MPALWRITDRSTFLRLRRRGRRVRRGPLTVTWLPGEPGSPPRVAYAIGRRVGGAVVRNRLRRRLRAVLTELGPSLPPGAYLIGAAPEAARMTLSEMRSAISGAIERLREGTGERVAPGSGA